MSETALLPRIVVSLGAVIFAFQPPASAEPGPDEEILEFLRTATVLSSEQIPGTHSQTRKLLLEKDGVRNYAAFRFRRVDKRGARLKSGTSVAHFRDDALLECAAYEMSRLLGMTQIPPTIERTLDGRRGSVQLWIGDAITEKDRRRLRRLPPNPLRWELEHETMRLFDSLIGNRDRNLGNRLIDTSWRLWWIDHTQTFAPEKDADNLSRIHRVEARFWKLLQSVDEEEIERRVGVFLSADESSALLSRRRQLIAHIRKRILSLGYEQVIYHH